MNKLLPALLSLFLLCFTALVFPVSKVNAAVSLSFDKTDVTVAQNNTFSVTVNINVDANLVRSSLATIQYDSADIQVVSIENKNFFPTLANPWDNSSIEITGSTSIGDEKTGSGQLATITFKALKGSNSSTISFVCPDTNILNSNIVNILTGCTPNTVNINFVGAGNPTPTDTPPAGVTPTPTPAGSQNTLPVCANLSASITTAVGTPLPVSFTCSGVDTDGYINGAYFDFGDGTHDTITKNVGSPGGITTTHTYTTIGSLGVSCKVQDNNQTWSPTPDVCKKIVYIQQKPRIIVRSAGGSASAATIPTPTPTPATINLVFVSPTSTPSPELTPIPTSAAPQGGSSPVWWLLGSVGIIGIGGIIYLLSKRGVPPPPPPPVVPPTPLS